MYYGAVTMQIMMLLIIVLIGLGLRHKKMFTDPVIKGVNNLLLQVAWPAMILMSAQKELSRDQIPQVLIIFVIGLAIMTITCLATFFLMRGRIGEDKLAVFAGVCALPNIGYVGLPVISAMYGSPGVIYLSGYIIALNVGMWTVFHWLIQENARAFFRSLINPGIIASTLSIVFIISGFRLPEPLLSLCNHLGSMTIPISMLLVGARLKETINLKQIKYGPLWLAMAIRLLLVPIAVSIILRLTGFSGMTYGVLVVGSALPAAAATQFMAERYGKDTGLAAQSSSISLLVCLATLPLVLWVAGI
ncbi:MAG: AEC family transporter [Christensenellales bacterium]|jgi:predicted permease